MSEPMFRPRSAIEIIDASFSIYRTHFVTLVAIWGMLVGPFYLAGAIVGDPAGSLISSLAGFMIPAAAGATVGVVSDAMHERTVSLGSAFSQISGRWGTLLGVAFSQSLLSFFGALLLIVPGVIVWCWTFAAPMTVVVEQVGGTAGAISRSKQLARGQFWHILGTVLVSWIICFVLMFAAGIGIGLIGEFVTRSHLVGGLLLTWAIVLATAFPGVASGVLYFDLRVRNDAYDVERLAQVLDESAPAAVNG